MSHHVVVTQHATHLDRAPVIGFGDRLRRLRLDVGMDQREFAEEEHEYVSTACQHDLHDRCRLTCKFCSAPCRCACHVLFGANDDL